MSIPSYLCISKSFANIRLFARTNFFINYTTLALNVSINWKQIEFHMKLVHEFHVTLNLHFFICKIVQLFHKTFHIFFIIFWVRQTKSDCILIFKQLLWYYGNNFFFVKVLIITSLTNVLENLQKYTSSSFSAIISFYLLCFM